MRKILTLFLPLASVLLLTGCVASYGGGYYQPVYVYSGVGLGNIIAIVISWSRNQSILLAILHGILGWFYVIYALLFSRKS